MNIPDGQLHISLSASCCARNLKVQKKWRYISYCGHSFPTSSEQPQWLVPLAIVCCHAFDLGQGYHFLQDEGHLKCTFCCIGSKAVGPCHLYGVVCTYTNVFHIELNVWTGYIPKVSPPGISKLPTAVYILILNTTKTKLTVCNIMTSPQVFHNDVLKEHLLTDFHVMDQVIRMDICT